MNLYELAVIVSATDRATRTLGAVTGAIDKVSAAGQKMTAWGERMTVQGALMQGAADKINGVLDSISAPADAVEDSLAKVSSVLNGPVATVEKNLGMMRTAAVDWSREHRASADQFLDTTYNMISAGLSEKAAVEGTRVAMQVATATFGDHNQAAALLAGLYNNMGNKSADLTSEMTRLGDVVTKTQQTFQLQDLNQLNEGLKYGVPTALQFGMSLEELSTVIGLLNSKQLAGSQAGTSFAATMRVMGKASKDLDFAIARTNDGSVDFINTVRNIEEKFGTLEQMSPDVQQAMQDAFGADGWMGLSLLIGKSTELSENLTKVQQSAGAAAEATAKIEGTKTKGLEIITNNFNAMKMAIADSLGPAIVNVTPKVIGLIRQFEGFIKAHPTLTKTVVLTLAVVGGILAIVAPIIMTVGALAMFGGHAMIVFSKVAGAVGLLANPITWIVLAIVGAALLIYKYWGPISGFFKNLWGGLKAMFADGFVAGMVRLIQLPKQLMGQAMSWAGGMIRDGLMAALEALPGLLIGWVTLMVNGFAGLLDGVASVWSALPGIIEGIVVILWNVLREWTPLGYFIETFGAVSEWLFGFNLVEAGENIVRTVWQGMKNLAHLPVDAMRGIAQKVRNLLPFSPAKDGPLRDIHRVRLVETIAGGLNPEPLRRSMHAVVAAAAMTAPVALAPTAIPTVPRLLAQDELQQARASSGGDVNVTIQISGNADASTVRQLEDLFKRNGPQIYKMMREQERLASRGEF